MSENELVWIDIETTGLSPRLHMPLELGFIITDLELKEIDRASWIIFEPVWNRAGLYHKDSMDEIVYDMHEKSGLWAELKEKGESLKFVQKVAADFLAMNGLDGTDPMCGSSVQFDRQWAEVWFPDVFSSFHYRNIDISSIKELMRRYSPEIYKELDERAIKREMHRVLPDLEDTISEFKFYREEFLYVPSDFI